MAPFAEEFEDLNPELFRGRPFDFPQSIPEPDHFTLLLDVHQSPSMK
jgi:hypothetical protein